MTKKADRGVIPLVIESAALKTNCKNWGDIFDCIKGGTITGAKIIHFPWAVVKNKFANAVKIMAKKSRGIPEKGKLSITFATIPVKIVAIFVFLKIAINWEATNIKIIIQ